MDGADGDQKKQNEKKTDKEEDANRKVDDEEESGKDPKQGRGKWKRPKSRH